MTLTVILCWSQLTDEEMGAWRGRVRGQGQRDNKHDRSSCRGFVSEGAEGRILTMDRDGRPRPLVLAHMDAACTSVQARADGVWLCVSRGTGCCRSGPSWSPGEVLSLLGLADPLKNLLKVLSGLSRIRMHSHELVHLSGVPTHCASTNVDPKGRPSDAVRFPSLDAMWMLPALGWAHPFLWNHSSCGCKLPPPHLGKLWGNVFSESSKLVCNAQSGRKFTVIIEFLSWKKSKASLGKLYLTCPLGYLTSSRRYWVLQQKLSVAE